MSVREIKGVGTVYHCKDGSVWFVGDGGRAAKLKEGAPEPEAKGRRRG